VHSSLSLSDEDRGVGRSIGAPYNVQHPVKVTLTGICQHCNGQTSKIPSNVVVVVVVVVERRGGMS